MDLSRLLFLKEYEQKLLYDSRIQVKVKGLGLFEDGFTEDRNWFLARKT